MLWNCGLSQQFQWLGNTHPAGDFDAAVQAPTDNQHHNGLHRQSSQHALAVLSHAFDD